MFDLFLEMSMPNLGIIINNHWSNQWYKDVNWPIIEVETANLTLLWLSFIYNGLEQLCKMIEPSQTWKIKGQLP